MHISKVQIKNFRSLKDVSVDLKDTNILIGPNNAGKTSFFDAINYAIGWNSNRTPTEDDFSVDDPLTYDPQKADPIIVIIEFREGYQEEKRFSENIEEDFMGVIQFDETAVKEGEEPIKFIRLKYSCAYSKEKGRFEASRVFLDQNDDEITGRNTAVRRIQHLSYFPFFYLETLRNIQSEINNSSSFWGRIKKSVDYSEKEQQIRELVEQLDELLITSEDKLSEVIERLRTIEESIKISSETDNISLSAISSRTWELLDGLTINLKTADSNISLPINKHGMGTQNIAIFAIFNAYLDILLPQMIENDEVTAIIGIEEPEAHVYPHSQRAIFEQITKINGQKIVSTHSPYIVDQADINDFILFRTINGKTEIRQIPQYRKALPFGLQEEAYSNNLFLTKEDLHTLKREIQFKNTELLFSSLIVMCEGDSEKVFFEMVGQRYLGKSLGRLGISIVSVNGKNYRPYLKLSRKDALDLPWLIFSDGEDKTIEEVKKQVLDNFSEGHLESNVLFLPRENDFESYCLQFYGVQAFQEIIINNFGEQAYTKHKKNLEKETKDYDDSEIIIKFIDNGRKTLFAEYLAEYVLEKALDLPDKIIDLFEEIKSILKMEEETR